MKKLLTLLAMAFCILAMTGCTNIDEGNFAIEKSWTNKIDPEPKTGFISHWTTNITEVTHREFLLPVENVRPKDKMGVMLEDLDVTYTVRLVPTGAIGFYRERGDITCPDNLSGCIIGASYLRKDAAANIGNTIRNYDSTDLLDNRKVVEESLQADFQTELDTLYGKDVFVVTEAKIANAQVAKTVEERIQAVALIASEKERSRATMEVLATREATTAKEYETLVNAAKQAGMTIDQALEFRRLDILRDMPASAVNINADSK